MSADQGSSAPTTGDLVEAARRRGDYVVPRCLDCGTTFWHPREHCPHCLANRVEVVSPPGPATVHAWTRNRRPTGGGDRTEVTVGYVEFGDGLKVLAELELAAGVDLTGRPVRPEARSTDDGTRFVFVDVSDASTDPPT